MIHSILFVWMGNICPSQWHGKIHLMLSFSTLDTDDVPDPYYGEGDGFERVLDLLETSLDALALKIANHQTVI